MTKNEMSIEFKGLREFENFLGLLPKKLEKSANAVVKNTGEEMRYRAKKYAPVDTWFMHDSIFTFHDYMFAEVHSTATYSGYVNYGTRYQYAQPFFSRAFEEMEKIFKKDMGDVLEGELSV